MSLNIANAVKLLLVTLLWVISLANAEVYFHNERKADTLLMQQQELLHQQRELEHQIRYNEMLRQQQFFMEQFERNQYDKSRGNLYEVEKPFLRNRNY